jgi:hypothetical protein
MSHEKQPARLSDRVVAGMGGEFETIEFARRRNKRRARNKMAKASRRKNR